MIIRAPELGDLEAEKRMQARSWVHAYQNAELGITPQWLTEITSEWFTPAGLAQAKQYFLQCKGNPRIVWLVAEHDNAIIGKFFGYRYKNRPDKAHLSSLYVEPEWTGKGVGQELLHAGLAKLGNLETYLDVADYNDIAIRFYQRNGFEIVPDSQRLYPVGDAAQTDQPLIVGVNAIPVISMMRPWAGFRRAQQPQVG
ncbi:MAG: GNAT family N-acetyltransferase [Cellulomonadaceae bacterium]|jgi:GNAT superfamily N-acetyltransferase|nr:GNAT family N-acetyltransferase [Cellulomonadaceae bacterium]